MIRPIGVRFHIQQESDIPASTQLYNQICFAIAARHYPPGHRLPSHVNWRCRRVSTATRSARCIASWRPMAWWKPWPALHLRARPTEAPRSQNATPHPQSGCHRSRPGGAQVRGWPAQCRLHAATNPRELLTREIDWRLRWCPGAGEHPREDIGASMLIAEELEPCLVVPVVVSIGRAGKCSGELQQRHRGDEPLFSPTGGGAGQEAQRPRWWLLTSTTSARSWPCSKNCAWQLRRPGEHQPRHPAGR